MSTTKSLPPPPSSNYIPPNIPQVFFRHVIVDLLMKRGFEGAEAGALTEIERLLEHHITNLFEESQEFAHLTGRREVNALDLVAAQEESGWGVRRMKRESRRKRGKAPQITYEPSTILSPPSPTLPTLSSLLDDDQKLNKEEGGTGGEDLKPDLSNLDRSTKKSKTGSRPIYAQDWMPSLPEKWTLISADTNHNPQDSDTQNDSKPTQDTDQPIQVTSTLLDFIKLTATERGDIPPELGVVNYRRAASKDDNDFSTPNFGLPKSAGAGASIGVKRKWGVKGVSGKA